MHLLRSRVGGALRQSLLKRVYHDMSFGFREPRPYVLPDYTPSQLDNRATNAPLLRYVDSLRIHGHRAAHIDPLDLLEREEVSALDPARYGLQDGNKKYRVDGILWANGFEESPEPQWWKLDDIVHLLRSVYVGRVAYEFMHSPNKSERLWWSHFLESSLSKPPLEPQERKRIYSLLANSETFDHFLQLKFPNLKRYGLEGAESMLPALDSLFATAAKAGIEHVVLCMPHRGRLSLLTDLLQYKPKALFHKIKGGPEFPEELGATGDVISHLESCPSLRYGDRTIKVSLLQNPSHLEAVNPVALGKTRAKQYSLLKSTDPEECMLGDKVMCVQLHGDAAFTGQGVVMEGLGLSNLPHYTSGGSVHIVVNIGYTTPATSARSSLYCSDIGKMINAPVLHVNGDFPEDVARAVETAFSYRNFFRKDIIIDLITYRRWGHNELDEPAFTQPLMYHKIRSRQSVPRLYEEKLISEGTMSPVEASEIRQKHKSYLESQLAEVDSFRPSADMLGGKWSGIVWPASEDAVRDPITGVPSDVLSKVGSASVAVPVGFEVHPRLQRHIKHRLSSVESGAGIDWGTAEAFAIGSLMLDGYDVRISGQDVGRGTFSHRHAMLVDQRNEGLTVPLNSLPTKSRLELANSSLSEMAVLGFEYGMSWENPNLLAVWEAQFGDFFNGSQVVIDTFVASAETKWLKQSGLVILLPHGLDGAGPEHSSCRIERWLQLTNDPFDESDQNVNMHICNATTPAQYFHLLRRQLKRNYRKPLIIASPKGLLRSPVAASELKDFESGTKFSPVLIDSIPSDSNLEKILFVSGKLYYDLARELKARALEHRIALVRIEELCPFPFAQVRHALTQLARSTKPKLLWAQEEPRNQGPYSHVAPRFQAILDKLEWDGNVRLEYVGRKESEVPAVGVSKWHARELAELLERALAVAA